MKACKIRSEIEEIARKLEIIGCEIDADNIRRATTKFYLADDQTMLVSTLKTGQLILKKKGGNQK